MSGADPAPTRSGRARRLAAIVVKESIQVVRDPSSIIVAFVLPLILVFIFGYGLSLDADDLRIALVLKDGSPEARSLADGFLASGYFDVRAVARDRREVEPELVAGRIRGYVVIGADFARRLAAGGPAPVQVIADGAEPNTARFVHNYARGVLSSWLELRGIEQARPAGPPIELEPRFWFNPELASRNFLVPGSIAIIMTLIGTLLTALVVAREWERGTMEALMATPIGIAELLVGKLVPYFLLGIAAMALCVLLALGLFGVPLRGSFAALTLVSAVFLLAALGQGLLISAVSKNQFVASQLALMSGFLPSFLLSGFIFEISSMPAPIRALTYAVQARYLVSSLQTIFLAGDVWALLLPNMGAMLLIAAIFLLASARSTRKRLQ